MELGVSHEQSLSSSTPVVDNIFDKYNKNLVPIRSLSDHDIIFFQTCLAWMGLSSYHMVPIGFTCLFFKIIFIMDSS